MPEGTAVASDSGWKGLRNQGKAGWCLLLSLFGKRADHVQHNCRPPDP
jgi:hypothetical protein